MKNNLLAVLGLAFLLTTRAATAQFLYITNNETISITGYTGPGGAVVIPDTINGLPVTTIGNNAFYNQSVLTGVTISRSVTSIGDQAFCNCPNLKEFFFKGDAPSFGSGVFDIYCGALCTNRIATLYSLPGTTGWPAGDMGWGECCEWGVIAGAAARRWNPLIETSGPSFGAGSGRFGFNIKGNVGIPIVVEACRNLANATWVPLQSLSLTNGAFYFSDPDWTNYPGRFYRIRSP
jgi:hypothetical protein